MKAMDVKHYLRQERQLGEPCIALVESNRQPDLANLRFEQTSLLQ
jgi:hypothetical protein